MTMYVNDCVCVTDSLQVAAVVGAHAGQSRLLLGLIFSLLLGLGLLPDPPLLLVDTTRLGVRRRRQTRSSRTKHNGRILRRRRVLTFKTLGPRENGDQTLPLPDDSNCCDRLMT